MFGRQLAMVVPEFMGEDGYLSGYMWGVSMLPSSEPPSGVARTDSVFMPVVRFDLAGEVVDTVGYEVRPPPIGSLEYVAVGGERYLPFFPSDSPARVRVHDGRIWVDRPLVESGSTGVVVVTRVRFDGDTLYSRAFAYEPVAYNDDFLDRIAAGASLRLVNQEATGYLPLQEAGPDSIEVRTGIRAAMDVPRFQPAIQGYWVANDGSLWLRREDMGGDAVWWVVLDPDGQPVGRVELPGDVWLEWSREGVLWAVDPDDYGVPWLVRYRIGG
jgi:hypothetical protein